MKPVAALLLTLALLAAAVGLARPRDTAGTDAGPAAALEVTAEGRNPWTHLRVNNRPDEFRFAFVTDRTGGARPGVFERAVAQLNLLQPEFVISVGDLIEGSDKPAELDRQWTEFEGWVGKLEMPFFYLPGNHDFGDAGMARRWRDKFGRSYYHFLYRGVLFLMLNSEEPPGNKEGGFSPEQIAYVRRTLDANKGVRWTVVVLHKPVWTYPGVAKTGWPDVEAALAGRPYTVFAGHKHRYEKFLRNGQRYYMLATTGGTSKLRGTPFGEFDELVWVTMKPTGPLVVNLAMEGIFPDEVDTRYGNRLDQEAEPKKEKAKGGAE